MSCVDLMAATPEGQGQGRRRGAVRPGGSSRTTYYQRRLSPLLSIWSCLWQDGGSEESAAGHSNCSRIIIFMAIVILELIAATHKQRRMFAGGATSRTAEKQKCLKDFGSCRVTEPSSAELSSVREQQFSGGKGILLVTWLPSKVCNANKFSFMWPTLNFRSHFAPRNQDPTFMTDH